MNHCSAGLAAKALCVLALSLHPLATLAQTLRIVGPGGTTELTLDEMQSRLHSQVVELDDPTYKKARTFDAFRLRDVMKLAKASSAPVGSVLIFKATDGYLPHLATKDLSNDAYLAFQEHGRRRVFEPIATASSPIDPGPYYLVWKGAATADLPWPYQLKEIEVVPDFERRQANLQPRQPPDVEVEHGLMLFSRECTRCHSINHVGGKVGPELNDPINVTEYKTGAEISRYIRNAPSVSPATKMPRFDQLNDADVRALVQYLKAMKLSKVPEKVTE